MFTKILIKLLSYDYHMIIICITSILATYYLIPCIIFRVITLLWYIGISIRNLISSVNGRKKFPVEISIRNFRLKFPAEIFGVNAP